MAYRIACSLLPLITGLLLSLLPQLLFAANNVDFNRQELKLDFKVKQLANADINQDGIDDILCFGNRSLRVLYGQASGKPIVGKKINFGKNISQVAVADFNQDLRPDIALLIYPPGNGLPRVKVFLNQNDGSFRRSATIIQRTLTPGLAAADFNGDGITDLALSKIVISGDVGRAPLTERNYLMIWQGDGSGQFKLAEKIASFRISKLLVADINQDGSMDILAIQKPKKRPLLAAWLNAGAGSFQPFSQDLSRLSAEALSVADLDLDEQADIALLSLGKITLLQGNDDQFYRSSQLQTHKRATDLQAGDLNQDGLPDLMTAFYIKKGLIRVFFQQSPGTYQATDYPVRRYPAQLITVDHNGDGKLDLISRHKSSKIISILRQTD